MANKDVKIVSGILILFAGFFVLIQSNKETLSILAGLMISAIGAYLILSNLKWVKWIIELLKKIG